MSITVVTNAKLYFGKYDFSGSLNSIALDMSADPVECTAFGDTTKKYKTGLKGVLASCEGYWDSATLDDVCWDNIGVNDVPISICPTTGAAGEVAYAFQAGFGEYTPKGSVGQMLAFGVKAYNTGSTMIRGNVLINFDGPSPGAGSVTGTAYELGAVTATQKVYGALHVLTAPGTIDVKIQSDNLEAFGDPTDKITFAQITGSGYEWKYANGPITDTWWRVYYTLGAGAGDLQFLVVMGIA